MSYQFDPWRGYYINNARAQGFAPLQQKNLRAYKPGSQEERDAFSNPNVPDGAFSNFGVYMQNQPDASGQSRITPMAQAQREQMAAGNMSFGDKLGMALSDRTGKGFDYQSYTKPQAMSQMNPMQALSGLMNMTGKGGQRAYQDEIVMDLMNLFGRLK